MRRMIKLYRFLIVIFLFYSCEMRNDYSNFEFPKYSFYIPGYNRDCPSIISATHIDSIKFPLNYFNVNIEMPKRINGFYNQGAFTTYFDDINDKYRHYLFYKHYSINEKIGKYRLGDKIQTIEFPDKSNFYFCKTGKTKCIYKYHLIKYTATNEQDSSSYRIEKALIISYSNHDNGCTAGLPLLKFGINETTDTIYTSLQPWIIKKVYPFFKGIIIQEKIKKIVVDYQYNPKDLEFYEHIEIIKE